MAGANDPPWVACVVGGTGVVGRYVVAHLAGRASRFARCYSCSRRPADVAGSGGRGLGKLRSVQVDLLRDGDGAAAARRDALADLGVTHLFYAGYAGTNTVAPNLALLANALEAVNTPALQHVHLVTGTKWYGYGLLPGPFKTPAKETDPRCLAEIFYYNQQDLLEAKSREAGATWTWSSSRPHTVIGFSVGSKMNLALVIAVYASLCKERGTPLHFPGNQAAFDAIYQMTDSVLLARGVEHLATSPQCANRAVNITNGDFIRWRNLWPRIARLFGLEPGTVRPMKLQDVMSTPDKAEAWKRLQAAHGLDASKGGYTDLVPSWGFADYVFHGGVDVMSDTGLSRRLGFLEFEDTEEMLLRVFREFMAARIVPGYGGEGEGEGGGGASAAAGH
jgi:nucleoside-diphosphate-sugar epimerase